MRRGILRLNAADSKPESVAREMTGAAGAPVGAKALEEGIFAALINRTISVVRGDESCGIEEREKIGNNGGRSDRRERQDPANQQPFSPIFSRSSIPQDS